jgi:hypothetical protein
MEAGLFLHVVAIVLSVIFLAAVVPSPDVLEFGVT